MDEKSYKDRKNADAAPKDVTSKDVASKDANRKADDKPTPKSAGAKSDAQANLTQIEQLMQRREVRIGMAVLAILVIVLGYVFVQKISEPDSKHPSAAAVGAEITASESSSNANPPPTVVTADPGSYGSSHSPTTAPGQHAGYASEAPHDDLAPPNTSYLPNRGAHQPDAHVDTQHPATAGDADGQRDRHDRGHNGEQHADENHVDPTQGVASKYSKYLGPDSAGDAPADEVSPAEPPADAPAADVANNIAANVATAADTGNHVTAEATDAVNGANSTGSRYADTEQSPGVQPQAPAVAKSVPLEPTVVEAESGDQPVSDVAPRQNDHVPANDIAAHDSHETQVAESAPVDKPVTNSPTVPQPAADQTAADRSTSSQPASAAPNNFVESPRAAPVNRTYVTLDGDSAATIAKKVYGDAALGAALLAFNGADLPADEPLAAGGEVLIPQRQILAQAFPQLMPRLAKTPEATAPRSIAPTRPTTPAAEQDALAVAVADNVPATEQRRSDSSNSRIYEVARGETLYDIARKELGRVSRWREILELNQEQLGGDVDAIEPGMKIRLPEEGRTSVARQRGELLWR